MLADQGILAKLEGRHIVLYKSDPAGRGREYQLKGRVETEAGDPIVGANVLVEGTTNGMVTNSKGEFALNVTAGARLSVSFIGYDAAQVEVGNRTHLTVVLKENNQLLDDVVVIGYGVQKKVNLTGSVAVRQMSEIENQPMTHASQALYSMPGVYINQASSKPGSDGATIRIRGVGTMSSSSPMVLVDGMEYSLNELNPGDIETISVLKDASASIYGSKAANGVILITTKQAKKGAPVVKLSANFGIQSATYVPDVVTDPIQYMNMRNQAELNEGKLTVTYNRDDILEYEEGMKHDKYIYPASDWYDLCYQNGFLQQYNARVSGGTDKISYSLGGGYMNQRGIMVANDDAERFSWDMKINAQVTKRLKVGISLLGNLRYNTDPIYGVSTTVNVINRALPIFGTQLPDGKWLSTWLSTPGRNNPENPLMELHEGNTKRQLHRILGRINIGYDLPWGIKYNANLGYVKVDHYSKDFKHAMYTYNPKTLERKNFSAYVSAKDWDNNAINYTFYNTLSWGKSFGGNHNFNVMVGTEYKRYDGKNFQAKKRDYFNNQLTALSVGATMEDISGGSSLELLFSYFGRITYDYKEKYLIDVTARYDGSSKFAPGNKWGFFPAGAAAWNVSDEKFWNVRPINDLKLRAGWGQTGNQAGLAEYGWMQQYSTNYYDWTLTENAQAVPTVGGRKNIKNQDLTWETSSQTNVGLDFALLNNRLNLSLDYYYKYTKDMLMDVPLPSPYPSIYRNDGEMSNQGFEITLSSVNIARKDFNWSTDLNVSLNRNKVEKLNLKQVYYYATTSDATNDNVVRMTPGHPLSMFWGYVSKGVDPETGDLVYEDRNGDGEITPLDKTWIGNANPKFTFGMTNNFSWKGLNLNILITGSYGNDIFNASRIETEGMASANNQTTTVLRRWRIPGQQTDVFRSDNPAWNVKNSSYWVEDGSYLKVKNITLSYDITSPKLKRINITRIQPYISLQNFITWTGYSGYDPEVSQSESATQMGIDWGTYPNVRTVVVGLNLTF